MARLSVVEGVAARIVQARADRVAGRDPAPSETRPDPWTDPEGRRALDYARDMDRQRWIEGAGRP